MTYDEAIAFWYGRINYEVRAAGPQDLKLERMRALLRLLGDPHFRVRTVHVTGTKGKGSTCAMLDAVLRAAGYRVGLFTSPHLEHVEERVRVDGEPISRDELAARMGEVAPAVRALEGGPWPSPTFFEISAALGFLHFCYRRCDVAVVEVGLGGRFDSTNVCRPLVSVITSVGLDHTAQLGTTPEAIAYQKAGIVKPRVPVVSGVTHPGARRVIERVTRENGCRVVQAGQNFTWRYEPNALFLPSPRRGEGSAVRGAPEGRIGESCIGSPVPLPPAPLPGGERGERSVRRPTVSISSVGRRYPPLVLGLLGEHQAANAAVAVTTIELLREAGLRISDAAVAEGLRDVRWPARVELVSTRPAVVLDTAHNAPSAEALVATLRQSVPVAGRKSVVFAVSSDKQVAEILRTLAGYFDRFHLTRYGNNPRCGPLPESLVAALAEIAPGKPATVHPTAAAAWRAARAKALPDDLVCVTGSVFLAGELRPLLSDPPAAVPAGNAVDTGHRR